MMQPEESMFYPAARRVSAEPSTGLTPTQQQLLPGDFSYLESLRFCGVDDQNMVWARVPWVPTAG